MVKVLYIIVFGLFVLVILELIWVADKRNTLAKQIRATSAYCTRTRAMLDQQATRLANPTAAPEARAAAARTLSDSGKLHALTDEITLCAPHAAVDLSRRDECWLASLTTTDDAREAAFQCLAQLAHTAATAIETP